jgi:hypothetical protein
MISQLRINAPVVHSKLNPSPRQPEQLERAPGDSVSLGLEPGIIRKGAAFLAASAAAELTAALCFVGGALYSATILGPIVAGIVKADTGPRSVEEAVFLSSTGVVPSALMEGPSILGSIGKEFAAPLLWGFEGGKEAFCGVYGYLTQ